MTPVTEFKQETGEHAGGCSEMVVFRTAVRRMLAPGSLLICRTEWSAVSPGWHSWHRRRRRFGRAQAASYSSVSQLPPSAWVGAWVSTCGRGRPRQCAAAAAKEGAGAGGVYMRTNLRSTEYSPSSVNRRQRQRQRTWLKRYTAEGDPGAEGQFCLKQFPI